MNGQNLIKYCKHIIIDKIYVGIVNFMQISNRVTVLDLCQNLDFAPYLENEWTQLYQIFLYTLLLTRSTSGLLRAISFSNRVMPLNIYLSSDSDMAGLL